MWPDSKSTPVCGSLAPGNQVTSNTRGLGEASLSSAAVTIGERVAIEQASKGLQASDREEEEEAEAAELLRRSAKPRELSGGLSAGQCARRGLIRIVDFF